MAFKDLMKSISGALSRVSADITRRPDGGTSHYRPMRKKTAPLQQGETAETRMQDLAYVHTGFTGMNPPPAYGYDQGTAFGGAGLGQPQDGRTGSWFRTGTQPQAQAQDYVGRGSFSGQQGAFATGRSNISYMPGAEPSMPQGQGHVEHIITLTGLKSCYEAIECMKDGETLIVMLDAIANESESMRCQDMLAGAAFTLGCSVRLLSGARIVIIAPDGVKILPEQAAAPDMARMPMPQAPAPAPAPEPVYQSRRERRNGGWNSPQEAQSPYTGTMPVASGGYAGFGGYGY